MSLNGLSDDSYRALCRVSAVISCIGMTCISLYHLMYWQKHSSMKKRCSHPLILSMLFLFFGVYTVFNITIEIFDDFHTHGFCGYSKWVAIPSYIAYKCCLYLILVNRIHEAFRESQYQVFTTKQLKIWAGVVIGWSVFNIILIWLTVTVHFEPDLVPKCHTSVGPPGLRYCFPVHYSTVSQNGSTQIDSVRIEIFNISIQVFHSIYICCSCAYL
eukprot:47314_1